MKARHTKDGKIYAVKVIRADSRYIEVAEIEAKVIEKLNKADPDNLQPIVRLHETFYYRRNFFLVFEKLGKNLGEVIKES